MTETVYKLKDNIIIVNKLKDINLNDALLMIHTIKQNYGYLQEIHILENSCNSKFNLKITDLPKIAREIKKQLKTYHKVRHADLVNSPFETALSFLFTKLTSKIKNYKYKAFSTEEAALRWLKEENKTV